MKHRCGALPLALATIVATLSLTPPAQASRACFDNFSERGDWTSGKSFKSFLEVQGDATKVFQAVGRAIATEGFAGLSANKDLGVVNAYQDNNGKHSPINAVITETQPGHVRVEVVFQLAPGLNSPSAAAKDELCKILEVALPEDQKMAAAAESGIGLKSKTGDAPLAMTVGSVRQSGVFPVLKIYSDIVGSRATVRTNEKQPVLVIRAPDDPSRKYIIVTLQADQAGNRRSVKMMSGRKLLKTAFTGKVDYTPDADWTVQVTAQQETAGVWKVVPKSNLEPGEYGLWDLEGMAVAPFGVDN